MIKLIVFILLMSSLFISFDMFTVKMPGSPTVHIVKFLRPNGTLETFVFTIRPFKLIDHYIIGVPVH